MISIIIPTLDEEKVITETLSRLRSQLTIPCEIIISDGGSRDNTVDLARPFADQIVIHNGAARQTIAQGKNQGAKNARGELLVFLDADCIVPDPDQFFASAMAHFQADEQLLGLTAYLRVSPTKETLSDKIILAVMNLAVRLRNNCFRTGDSAGGEFQMVRKDAFLSIGGYREDLVTREDRDLFIRLARVGRTMSDPALIVLHSGRRAHILGWPRLIFLFVVNTIYFHLTGRVFSKEWKPVR